MSTQREQSIEGGRKKERNNRNVRTIVWTNEIFTVYGKSSVFP